MRWWSPGWGKTGRGTMENSTISVAGSVFYCLRYMTTFIDTDLANLVLAQYKGCNAFLYLIMQLQSSDEWPGSSQQPVNVLSNECVVVYYCHALLFVYPAESGHSMLCNFGCPINPFPAGASPPNELKAAARIDYHDRRTMHAIEC